MISSVMVTLFVDAKAKAAFTSAIVLVTK